MAGRFTKPNTFVAVANAGELDKEMGRLMKAYRELPLKVARRSLRKVVTREARLFKNTVKFITPLGKTGNLRRGFGESFRYRPDKDSGFFGYRIGFDKKKSPHALMVEEGTAARFRKILLGRVKNKRGRWKKVTIDNVYNGYSGRMPKNPFLKTTFERSAGAIAQGIARGLATELDRILRKSVK